MARLRTLLSIVGTQGARGMTIALCIGAFLPVIWPGLGTALRPGLPLMIAVFLVNAFAQLDLGHARQSVTRPMKLLSATGWAILVMPALFWAFLNTIGRDRFDPDFVLSLSLQAGAALCNSLAHHGRTLEMEGFTGQGDLWRHPGSFRPGPRDRWRGDARGGGSGVAGLAPDDLENHHVPRLLRRRRPRGCRGTPPRRIFPSTDSVASLTGPRFVALR